jgi:arylsulfatase A-like enzyme
MTCRRALASLVLPLLAACARPRGVATDFLARAPDEVAPTAAIRPRDEATRQLLEAGLSLEGERLAVGAGEERLVFAFLLVAPRAGRVAFAGEAPAALVGSAFVNDVSLGTLRFPAGAARTELELPASALRAGANLFALELPRATRPGVRLRLAAIEFEADGPPAGEAVRWSGGQAPTLLQAAPSGASWLVEPAGDRLELAGRLAGCAAAPCAVALEAEADGLEPRVLWRADAAGAEAALAAEVELPALRGRPLRLTARFASGPPGAALAWTRLRITGGEPSVRARPAPVSSDPDRPNVLVFLVDTLRRDHLSLYGYPRPTAPELERLASEAVVFEDARTQSSWTSPAVASLFTGEHPSAHGIADHGSTLAPGFETLAERLKRRGYRTAAFVVNPGVGKRGGFEQGFDEYRFLPLASAEDVVGRALAWAGRGPWFLYLHLMDPHYPYSRAPAPFDALVRDPDGPPPRPDALSIAKLRRRRVVPTQAELDYLRSLYDSEVAYVDGAFGGLLRELKRRGLFETTWVVFVSDHGEEFGDHGGYYHGHTLYDELTRAALVVKPAGRFAPCRVGAPVQTVDLYPTLAAAAGAPRGDVPGRDLRGLLAGEPGGADAARPLFSETELRGRLRSVVLGRHKLVLEDRRAAGLADLVWLYDLAADSGERNDRRAREPVRAAYLAASLRRHLELARRRSAGAGRRALDEETLAQLRALGYVDAEGD